MTAGHGEMAVQAVNVPVSVGGMDVAPGELIHMDENGAVKFPPQHAPAVVKNAQAMLDDEARRLVLLRKAKTAAEVRAAHRAAPTRRRRRSSGAIFINSDVVITNNTSLTVVQRQRCGAEHTHRSRRLRTTATKKRPGTRHHSEAANRRCRSRNCRGRRCA